MAKDRYDDLVDELLECQANYPDDDALEAFVDRVVDALQAGDLQVAAEIYLSADNGVQDFVLERCPRYAWFVRG